MSSPQALFLSLAATVCAFALVLVVIASHASSAATLVVSATHAPRTVAVVAQEISDADSVAWTVARTPAASR
jgi:hypothetical protein